MAGFTRERRAETLRRAFDCYLEVGEAASAVAVAQTPTDVVAGLATGAEEMLTRALEVVPTDSHEAGSLFRQRGFVLARIHRRTPMDGVRTAEGGG